MGDAYLKAGDIGQALKAYTKAKEHCTVQHAHNWDSYWRLIVVNMEMDNWTTVSNLVIKAHQLPDLPDNARQWLNAVRVWCLLDEGRYDDIIKTALDLNILLLPNQDVRDLYFDVN